MTKFGVVATDASLLSTTTSIRTTTDGGRANVGHAGALPKEGDPLSGDDHRKNNASGLTPYHVQTLKLLGMVGDNSNETMTVSTICLLAK